MVELRAYISKEETPLQMVMRKLKFKSQAKLAKALGIHRTCPSEWNRRLGGNIPPKHWSNILDIALPRGVFLTIEDLRKG